MKNEELRMKNDLNFAQNSTAWLKHQCRSVLDPAGTRESWTILSGLKIHQSLCVTPTKPTSWCPFRPFCPLILVSSGTKTGEQVSILGEIWGMKNEPGA